MGYTLRVLVVDDEDTIRDTVAEALLDEGYVVDRAADGAEALRMLEQTPADLVLLDMRMPVLDGWGFARAVQERGLTIPIVVMTAAQNARRWADEIGARACLPKPFLHDDLYRVVEQASGDRAA